MTYWIEVHCDTPLDEAPMPVIMDTRPYKQSICANFSQEHPTVFVSRLSGTAWRVIEAAKRAGFKRTRRGWQCPHCQKYRKPGPAVKRDRAGGKRTMPLAPVGASENPSEQSKDNDADNGA